MTLLELNNNLKRYANFKVAEIELYKFLKENDHLIFQYQIRQLFEDSIGADGIDLGFYSSTTKKFDPLKKSGSPFTMISSGQFIDGMYIEVKYRNIKIGSTSPFLSEMLLNPAFDTVEFFGLTRENLILLKRFHTTKFLREWLKRRLRNQR